MPAVFFRQYPDGEFAPGGRRCLEAALGENDTGCALVVIHASLGHDYQPC